VKRIKWNRQINDPRFWAACADCGVDVGPFRLYAHAEGVHYCEACRSKLGARLYQLSGGRLR